MFEFISVELQTDFLSQQRHQFKLMSQFQVFYVVLSVLNEMMGNITDVFPQLQGLEGNLLLKLT